MQDSLVKLCLMRVGYITGSDAQMFLIHLYLNHTAPFIVSYAEALAREASLVSRGPRGEPKYLFT